MQLLGCSYDPAQVGMFLWGRIPDSYTDAEELTEILLHEARVFITPGHIFGANGKRYIRISLCAKQEKLKNAVDRITRLKERKIKEAEKATGKSFTTINVKSLQI